MWLAVTPSARQCGPPELLATLPPIVHVCWLLGSGAKCSPWMATARLRSRLRTPGSTHARRLSGSTARIRFIFVSEITTAPSGGTAPPARPVPDPRATNGTPASAAMPTHSATSAVVVGKHTTEATPAMCPASRRYRDNSAPLFRTRSGPRTRRNSSCSAAVRLIGASGGQGGARGSPVQARRPRHRRALRRRRRGDRAGEPGVRLARRATRPHAVAQP